MRAYKLLRHMEQVRIPKWIGVLQVQITNGLFYLTLINSGLLSVTAWAAIGPSLQLVVPWARFWMFVTVFAFLAIAVMLLDYKYMYPVRQAFLNEQACKHKNPAMDILIEIQQKLEELEKRLNENTRDTTT